MDKDKYLQDIREKHSRKENLSAEQIEFLLNEMTELQEENLTLWCQKGGLEKALRIANITRDVRCEEVTGERRLVPNAIGKEITFQSSSSFKGESFYHMELSDGNTYALVSKSPIEVYHEEELED